jgi:hypothetical protein
MVTAETQGCWIQCQHCGHLHHIDQDVPIDKLYVACICPKCDEYGKGLNCGSDKSDVYKYMCENVDPRYYQY